jgi:hypothetical protein
MGIEDRDWWIDRLRRRVGYTERAQFRVSRGRQDRRHSARRFFAILGGIVAAGWAAVALLAFLLKR